MTTQNRATGIVRYLVVGAALGAFSQTRRGKRTAHVLRGRPLMYRISVADGAIVTTGQHTLIERCSFTQSRQTAGASTAPADPRWVRRMRKRVGS